MSYPQSRIRGAKYFGAAALLLIPTLAPADDDHSKDEVFKVTGQASLPAGQKLVSFDISFVDPTIHTYVLGDRNNKAVDVVNTDSLALSQLTATPPFAGATGNNNTSGPDGVIIIHHTEVWAGDGNSTVKVLPFSGGTTHVISTGGVNRADEMCYDAKDDLVMVANNADSPPFGTIISAKTYTITHQIKFTNSTNGAEQCQWSPRTGMFYITIPGVHTPDDGTGVVEVIDPKSGTIVNTFPIPVADCSTPQGMAVGPNSQIMIGCNGSSTNGKFSGIIINENSGAVIGVIPNESGPDEIYYNEGDGQYFLGRSAALPGTTQFLGVVDATGHRADQSVETAFTKTGGSAHSVAADSGTNRVFVPTPAGISTSCSTGGGVDANGCIAVFTAKHDDKAKSIVRRHDDDDDRGRDRD
jgi:hypothetical protein